MLSLSTHEPHFYIIREALVNKNFNARFEPGNEMKKMLEEEKRRKAQQLSHKQLKRFTVDFNIIDIYYVRDYLDDFYGGIKSSLKFGWDLENIIDDFIFLCFFGGNDFLPHLPALSIHQGGIDILMCLYKLMLPHFDNYITTKGQINLKQVEEFMIEFSRSEEGILQQIEQSQKEMVTLV
jgi:5'-3' exoribonuclease 2